MKKPNKKKWIRVAVIAVLVIAVAVGGFFAFQSYRASLIPKMTFDDILAFTTKDNENAAITVGVIQNGEVSYRVYGMNAEVLPQTEHIYEIGSLTKTVTSALVFKAVDAGKLSLDDSIDRYLELPSKSYYPTIRRLVTHSSGYKEYYLETPMVSNFFHGDNGFYDVSTEQLITRIGKIDLQDRDYAFHYSNFGMAVLGAVLSEVYGQDYHTLVDTYLAEELGLNNTVISDGSGDLGKYWRWRENDAYLSAGALTSTITDMLRYAALQLAEEPDYLAAAHEALAQGSEGSGRLTKMNIRVDAVGGGWMIDTENNIIWHNGATSDYNCYLGFDPGKQLAVVILSNLSPDYRIPATVMGVKLLTELQAK